MAKQKALEIALDSLSNKEFQCPNVSLEQYCTPPGIAAEMLHAIDLDVGLSEKTILDLGCGYGILGLGCVYRGALRVLGIDIDKEALKMAEHNRDEVGETNKRISFTSGDVLTLRKEDIPSDFRGFDLVVSNPPFGTRTKQTDLLFVKKGLEFSDVIYSIHKSSTRDFLLHQAKKMGVRADLIFENMMFPISNTYIFHKLKKYFVQVDIIKFQRNS